MTKMLRGYLPVLVALAFAVLLSASVSGKGKPEVIGVWGDVPGRDLAVHAWVVVQHGADRAEAAREALARHGARPIKSAQFSLTGVHWPVDSASGTNLVVQNYNPANDPTGGAGQAALVNTHATWKNVATSTFEFSYGGTTTRCPSLVSECSGPQTTDGNNDVAWMALGGCCTLGVTWYTTSGTPEADMALNTNFNWDGSYDAETVFLHENGHVAGLGHSDFHPAVMEATYWGQNRVLFQDDIDAISILYPGGPVDEAPMVLIASPEDDSNVPSGSVITFDGSASDGEDGDITTDLVWTSDIDGQIGTGGGFAVALGDGTHTITASVTDSAGNGGSSSVTVMVGEPTVGDQAIVSAIGYATEGGRNKDKHLSITITTEDQLGEAIAGASVSMDLSRNGSLIGSGTGTTGANGAITFTVKNVSSGCYSTDVTNVVAVGLTWDGATPDNEFCK